jgi:hypothetical protein
MTHRGKWRIYSKPDPHGFKKVYFIKDVFFSIEAHVKMKFPIVTLPEPQ